MTASTNVRVTTALAVSVVISVAAILLPKLLVSDTISRILTTQGVELALSLLAIAIFGRANFAAYGFTMPRVTLQEGEKGIRWVGISFLALSLGAVATLIILVSDGTGNPIAKSLNFLQVVLLIWISSSTIEEIFTRGFLQGHLAALSDRTVNFGFARVELPAVISALFFMCMHLVMLMSGIDAVTLIVLLVFTFSLGLVAGLVRARTGSLLPAIGVHFLANVGGVVGGIIFAILTVLITGKPPEMP